MYVIQANLPIKNALQSLKSSDNFIFLQSERYRLKTGQYYLASVQWPMGAHENLSMDYNVQNIVSYYVFICFPLEDISLEKLV